MKNKRLLKTIVGLAIAFAMTFTPFSGSYALLVNPAGNGDGQVTETQATDAASEDVVSEETEPSQPEVTTEESEPAEQAEPELNEDMVPVDEVAEKAERTEYIWKDEKVKVTAVLSDAEAIPDDAELVAKAVTSKSDDYDYDAYMEALNKNSDSKYNAKNTLLYDVAFMKDGVEIQPESGTVSVTFEFLDKQLSKSIGAKKASDVNVIHLPLKNKIRDKYDTTADAKNIDANDIVFEELTKKDNELAVSVKNEKVQFETSEFSVYAYTVDFEYTDPETGKVYTYNLEGAGSITLKELAIILGITKKADADEFIDNVENVTFSNENLLKVKKTFFRGWVLKSLQPFSSEELLTITMNDGQVIEVIVTDDQIQTSNNLADFLVSASISATQNEQGQYVVRDGTTYSINLHFKEDTSIQFPDDDSDMIYTLPEGLTLAHGDQGTFRIRVDDGGTEWIVEGNTYRVQGNKIIVNFNAQDPHFNRLTAASNATFNVAFDGEFSGERIEIPYKDGTKKVIIVDKSNKVDASKSARLNLENDTVDYTVAIRSTGKSYNVVVKDTITDLHGVLSLDSTSIVATSSTGQPVEMDGGANGNSFKYTIPSMKDGEVITFKYSAKIDTSKIPIVNGKVVTTGENSITVYSDGDPTPDVVNKKTVIDYTPGVKKGNAVVGEDGKTLTWTITANEAMKVSMAGGKITDSIGQASRQYMEYSGQGITVKVLDADGDVRTDNVSWNSILNADRYSWTYTIPQSDAGKAYKYIITYTTEVDLKGSTGQVIVNNDVTTDGGGKDSGTGIVGKPLDVEKKVEKVDLENMKIDWVVTFGVPKEGLTEAVVTDTYPKRYVINGWAIEKIKEGSTITVTGLKEGETWVPVYGEENVKITFYQDPGHNTPGLKGGSDRTIVVRLSTEINQDWLNQAASDTSLVTHENTVDVNGTVKKAQAIVESPTVDKKAEYFATREVNGVKLPIYKYEIVLANVSSGDNVVRDVYDTSLLEPYVGNVSDLGLELYAQYNWFAWYIFGGNIYDQNTRGGQFDHTFTANGMEFRTSSAAMPRDPNSPNGFYPKYKLVYFLTVKDEHALNTIMERAAASEDHKYTLNNTAEWNDLTDGGEITYEHKALNKKILTEDKDLIVKDGDIWADFEIDINPQRMTLNNGNPMTLTDTVTNLSVDVTSISVTPSEGVTWDMSGNTVTYNGIPDGTHVKIAYRARVIYSTIGEEGETISIPFSNVAEMNGYTDNVEKTAQRNNSGDGAASVPKINLLKYEGGNMTKRLKGAVFVLLDKNKNPIHDIDGNVVSFTTDNDGLIYVQGDQHASGWSIELDTRYYLREVVAPKGYKLAHFDYSFQISSDGTTNYEEYIYHSNDTMTAKNYPGTDILVKKVWEDGNEKHDSDTVTVKLKQKIGNGEYSDTIRRLVKQDGTNQEEWKDVEGPTTLVLSKDNDWQGGFKDLPATVPKTLPDSDEDYVTVDYAIEEILVNDQEPEEGTVSISMVPPAVSPDDPDVPGGTYQYTINNKSETGSLKIRKTVTENGQAPSDAAKAKLAGTYTFTLYTDEACEHPYTVEGQTKTVTLTVPDTGAAVTSEEVTDLPAGDYWIKETDPTNGSTPVINPVKVKVVAGKTGDEAVIAEFTNNLATGEGEIKVQKVLNGREWTNNDRFTFTLSAAEGTPMPGKTEITITKTDADQIKSFGKIEFTQIGTYTYKVKETKGTIGGVIYDETEHTVSIKVVKDSNGNLVAEEGDSLIKAVTITNTYKAKGTAEVEVAKHLEGKTLEEGTFTFTISAEDNAPMNKEDGTAIAAGDLTVTNGADAVAVKFPKFHYTLENAGKTYIYKIVENAFNIPGVSRDTETGPEQIYAKVTVGTDKGDGTLTASTVKYYSDKACTKELQKSQFINKYDNKGSLKIRKTVKENGQAPSDAAKAKLAGTYTFTLYTDEACEHPYTVEGQTKTVTLTVPDTGAAVTSEEVTDLPAGDYWIKETDPTNGSTPVINPVKVKVVAGKTGDEAVIAEFTNNLATGEGEIKVQKVLNGREWTNNDRFTFTLSAAEGTPMPGKTEITITKTDADQIKSFGKIEFTQIGTYTYKVKETKGTIGGVIYDETEHTVSIKVVKDSNGNLVAEEGDTLIKTETITNTYDAKGKVTLSGKKDITGRPFKAGDSATMKIEALEPTDAPMPEQDTITLNPTEGTSATFQFGDIEYDLSDIPEDADSATFKYKVTESAYSMQGVGEKDSTEYTVTVKISDNGDGTLKVEKSENAESLNFTNTYDAKGSIPLKGTKKFKYGEVDNETGAFKETFTFSVYKEEDFDSVNDRNSPAFILNMKDKAVSTASTADIQVNNGKVSFDFNNDLEYTLADIVGGEKTAAGYWTKEFHYVVVEDIPATAVKKTVDGKDFYYDSSIDSSGKQKDIKYDATVYPVTITVTDTGKGTLAVKRGEEEGPLTFDFENEKIYTKLLLTKDIDKYVTGDTKGELTNVTCVFKVKYKDPILGRTVTRTVSVQFDAQHVSADTAEVDKIPIEDPDKTFQVIEVYSIDYAGKVKQGKELKRVDQATGLPIWTVAFENEKEDNITGSGVINKVEKGDDNKFHITNRRDRTSEYPSPMPQGND